MRYRPPVLL